MSGGSYEYAYTRVRDMADGIRQRHHMCPKRVAFAAHLDRVADAMWAIEWEDSGDGADWEKFVDAVTPNGSELAVAVELAEKARDALDGAIERAYPKNQRPTPPQVPMKVGRMGMRHKTPPMDNQ
jgi:hypothetical protein